MKRISGYLLIVLGLLHIILGCLSGWAQLKVMFHLGIWNALGQQSQAACMQNTICLQLNTIWWFISWGIMLVLFGALCAWIESRLNRTIPRFVGWMLLFTSCISAILTPISGFWFVALIAIYMIRCDYLNQK